MIIRNDLQSREARPDARDIMRMVVVVVAVVMMIVITIILIKGE